jgi:hypothetical protein
MNEFALIFRTDCLPEVRFRNRLGSNGTTLKPGNSITNGPYAENKEIITGYIIIRAESIDEAAELAKGCPLVVGGGGLADVRNIITMNG